MLQLEEYTPREIKELEYIVLQNYRWLSFGEKRFLLRNFNLIARRFAFDLKRQRFTQYIAEEYPEQGVNASLSHLKAVSGLVILLVNTEASIMTHGALRTKRGIRDYIVRRARILFHLKQFVIALRSMRVLTMKKDSTSLLMNWMRSICNSPIPNRSVWNSMKNKAIRIDLDWSAND